MEQVRGRSGLRRRWTRVAALAPAACLAWWTTACVSLDGAGSRGAAATMVAHHPASSQIMVTLRAPTPQDAAQRIWELEQLYRVRHVAAWEMSTLGVHCVLFQSEGHPVSWALRLLGQDKRVEVAQEVHWFQTLASTARSAVDPYRHLQTNADALHLDEAQTRAKGTGITVAVIDTGVDVTHPDLAERIVSARNFVDQEDSRFTQDVHGTAVSGVIAASGNNGLGILGVAPEAKILALKACWPLARRSQQAVCNSYTLALALDFAILHGARIINLSLAGPRDPILEQLVDTGIERGIAVVAAVDDTLGEPFPASLPSVVAVRALEDGDPIPPQVALPPSLAAPGREILSTVPGGTYDFFDGSSFAAAQVSGVAALVLELRPELKPAELRQLLFDTAGDNPGQGVVDAAAAVERAGEDRPTKLH
ncbi:MAG: S8 family serine peptidase [Acidobacteria bacterium]|nr:S8 family serine peptidase [Acidobacteriota bacterium]